jgi:hypothetical protein
MLRRGQLGQVGQWDVESHVMPSSSADIPTVPLSLTYTAQDDERPAVNVAGIPLWLGLLVGVYWLANRVGGRL